MNNKTQSDTNNFKIDSKAIESAKKGNTDALINSLSNEDKQKLNSLLNDKEAIKNILKTPQAAAILKALGGKNG